jgi:hypothetical protein
MKSSLSSWLLYLFCLLSLPVADARAEDAPFSKVLERAGTNNLEIAKALENCPDDQQEGMAFLVRNMPERDLQTLSAGFLLENTRLAYEARDRFPWGKTIPEEVFLNDVLPYAILNERRDAWRKDFYDRFSVIVNDCKTIEEAVLQINKHIKAELGVKYSTKRKKADQSPYESMESSLASCTGLSILLTDALRSVAIPSRIAGTPSWTDKRGNHNWNEVWVNGQWAFTEYENQHLNKAWFLKDAAAANATKWEHKVYASSFKPAEHWFPLVWDLKIRYVHAVDVSAFYKEQYALLEKPPEGKGVPVKVRLFNTIGGVRVAARISIFNEAGTLVASGRTSGPEDDLNNVLEIRLEPGNYVATFQDGETCRTVKFMVGDETSRLDLTLE